MPSATSLYPDIDSLDPPALHARYHELKRPYLIPGSDQVDAKRMPDEVLREMVVIMGALRRKSSGPPKAKAERAPKDVPGSADL